MADAPALSLYHVTHRANRVQELGRMRTRDAHGRGASRGALLQCHGHGAGRVRVDNVAALGVELPDRAHYVCVTRALRSHP
jgi:hypothetical protein